MNLSCKELFLLEEYKALRAEVVTRLEHKLNLQRWSLFGLGGTSTLWGGQLAEFDEMDLTAPGREQGCSTLFTEGHRKYGFETAESGGVAVLRDCVGLIEPENIVGEASNSREDARIFSNARCIFA